MSSEIRSRHVHFAPDQNSGSHRPPAAFRKQPEEQDLIPVEPLKGIQCFPIRTRVPFDLWFRDHKCAAPLTKTVELWQARGSAVCALAKGLAETIRLIFIAIFYGAARDNFRKEMSTQWHGICLSATAIASPNAAKEKFLAHWENLDNCRNERANFYWYQKA